MKSRLFIDKGVPFAAVEPETLSDNSVVWNLHFRGGDVIHCINERSADEAMNLIALALKAATHEAPLIL